MSANKRKRILFYGGRYKMMGIRPLGDRVVIRKMEAEEKTQGGLILTSSAKEQPTK